MPLSLPPIFRSASENEVQRALDFLERSRQAHVSGLASLDSRDGREDFADFLADEKYYLDELLALSEQMTVVALYRVVELNTIKILRWRWTETEIEKQNLYKVDKLRSSLKAEFNCNLPSLVGFRAVDELREANNAVKHRGCVTKKLARFPQWVADDPLIGLAPFIERVAPEIPKYLEALAFTVIPPPSQHGASC